MKNLRPSKAATVTTKAGVVVLIHLENSSENKNMTAQTESKNLVGKEFVITREFDASRELVFQAWTDPKHLAQWWGPRGFTCPRCEIDVRPGGLIRIDMRAPN